MRRVKQKVESASALLKDRSDPERIFTIVVEEKKLGRRQVEEFRSKTLEPLGNGIQGLSGQQDVLEQDEQNGRRFTQAETVNERVEDGHSADLKGLQGCFIQVQHSQPPDVEGTRQSVSEIGVAW